MVEQIDWEALKEKFYCRNVKYVKYTAAGNYFMIVDETKGSVVPEEEKGDFAKLYCPPWFGIGANEVIFLEQTEHADVRMRLIEPDGSESEMCGNGVRCIADYMLQKKGGEECRIEVKAGAAVWEPKKGLFDGSIRIVTHDRTAPKIINGSYYCVDMGPLVTNLQDMPSIDIEAIRNVYSARGKKVPDQFINQEYRLPENVSPIIQRFADLELRVSLVHTGEPHLVIFVEDIKYGSYYDGFADRCLRIQNRTLGDDEFFYFTEAIKCDARYFKQDGPNKQCNVNLVQKISGKEIRILTNERGTGVTPACGTGSTACAAVAQKEQVTNAERIKVENPGGVVYIKLEERLKLIGPAQEVSTGITGHVPLTSARRVL